MFDKSRLAHGNLSKKNPFSIILFGFGVVAFTVGIVVFVHDLLGILVRGSELTKLYYAILLVLISIGLTLVIRNLFTERAARGIFLLSFLALISISDTPANLSSGRSTILFGIPIILSSFILSPRFSFVFASLSSFAIAVLSIWVVGNEVPNIPVMGVFFAIAFISYTGSVMLQRTNRKLSESFVELAETTSRVLGVRDPYTQRHEQRVGELAREVGKRMGLNEDRLLGLYLGGVLHDIGKIAIPETILTKPGELKDVEWEMIRSHPEVGYDKILADTDFPWPVAEMTLHHHERLDGSGYPDGLEGDELTTEVRILGTVDVVEAMSTMRPYRSARSKEETLEEIRGGKGTKYDPEVVDILVRMIEEGEIKFGGK